MTATTPLGLPYPTGGDPASDIPAHVQALAEALDDYIGGLTAVAPADWVTVSGSAIAGWGGSLAYARRAGVVTIELEVTRSAFNPGDGIFTMPLGFRPSRIARATCDYGETKLRPVTVSTAGLVAVAGFGAQSDGIYGSITYPV